MSAVPPAWTTRPPTLPWKNANSKGIFDEVNHGQLCLDFALRYYSGRNEQLFILKRPIGFKSNIKNNLRLISTSSIELAKLLSCFILGILVFDFIVLLLNIASYFGLRSRRRGEFPRQLLTERYVNLSTFPWRHN